MEYPDLVYSEIVIVGRNIELNMVNIQKEEEKNLKYNLFNNICFFKYYHFYLHTKKLLN